MNESDKIKWMLRASEIQKCQLRLTIPYHKDENIMLRKGFIPFLLKAGHWTYDGYLDVRARTLDDIRASLEKYVRDGNTQIVLPCNCETINIKLDNFQAINDMDSNIASKGFSVYTTLAFCHITVESLNKSQTHLCNVLPTQAVTELYNSLMNVALQDYSVHKVKLYQILPFPKITFYNKIKSTTLEQYHLSQLLELEPEEPKAENNKMVKGYYKFEANHRGIILTDSEGRYYHVGDNDTLELEMGTIHVPGLRQWMDEYIAALNRNRKYFQKGFDVKNWFLTGRWIAMQIRRQLPQEYDLWYHAPSQDQARFNRPAILISECS